MCKMLEDLLKETEICATVKTCRRHKVSDNEILIEIQDEFDLTETEARAYL